jgi:hypothetical protein
MPKDDRFLDLFEQHSQWMAGAEALRAARTLRARHDWSELQLHGTGQAFEPFGFSPSTASIKTRQGLLDDKREVECADGSRHRQDCDNIGPHRTRDIVTDHRPSPALRFKHRYSKAMLMNGFKGRARVPNPRNSATTVTFR